MSNIYERLLKGVKKHSPEILVGMGLVGMTTSTVMAVKATPKALDLMEDKKSELGTTYLTRKEVVETTWKQYVPSAGLGIISAACIIGGTAVNNKRSAALATVYALSESSFKEFQRKTKEIVGEDKYDEINKQAIKARLKETPTIISSDTSEYVTVTGDGDTLMYDTLSGRYFRSSINAIERAVNNINKTLLNEHYVTVNEFYDEIKLRTTVGGGLIGWDVEKEMVDIGFETDMDVNGNPYVIIEYRNRPIPLYNYNY